MNLAPLDLSAAVGTVRYALIFGAVGFGFGFILEMAGFGDTRKLAAQFYLKDMTVLKVMFTGIVVASLMLALASSFGLLDLHRVWVNPTFLWSEIAGGAIMGVGFVLGGFCPGTSLVAAATLKIDGMLFLVGAPRCGSTILARSLAAHPDVIEIGENGLFDDEWRSDCKTS